MSTPLTPPELPTTLGALRSSGYEPQSVREEIRKNLEERLAAGLPITTSVLGFEDSVLPQLETALLAGHDIILLGERGQAKTRIIRSLVELLDEWLPIVAGSDVRDDPFASDLGLRYRPRARARGRDAGRAGFTGAAASPRNWPPRTPRWPTSLARSTRSRSRAAFSSTTRQRPQLRPRAEVESRHLRNQRAARSRRAHPGRPAQCPRGARRADPRTPRAPRASTSWWWRRPTPRTTRIAAGSSRRLKDRFGSQIRTHYPFEIDDRDRDHAPGGSTAGVAGPDHGAVVHQRHRRARQPRRPAEPRDQPELGRLGAPLDRELRDGRRQRAASSAAHPRHRRRAARE